MMSYWELSETARGISGIAAVLVLMTAVSVFVIVSLSHMGWRIPAASFLAAAVLFLLFQGIIDVELCLYRGCSPSFLAEVTGNLPWPVIVLILMAGAGAEAVLLRTFFNRKKQRLTAASVKEGLDTLSDGICFYNEEGQVLLANTRMNDICGQLFHREILNGKQFWQMLEGQNIEDKGMIPLEGEDFLVRTPDGVVWDICRKTLDIRQVTVYELSASDVTGQYLLGVQLQERNRTLAEVNRRLKVYSREAELVNAEKEVLEARVQIHDNVGRSLLAFRSYLEQPEQLRSRKELLLLWRCTVGILRHETAPAAGSDSWELLRKAAEVLEVKIMMEGNLPEPGTGRELLIAALHECLTNTVKHADGDEIHVTVRSDRDKVEAEITNNGTPPSDRIRETGGLKTLRTSVEHAGGRMMIQSVPRFLLRLYFPAGGET